MSNKKEKEVNLKGISTWIIVALSIGFIFGLCPWITAADTFTPRTVTIINPMRPGGGTDIELRNLVPYFQKYLGQTVVIKPMRWDGLTSILSPILERRRFFYHDLSVIENRPVEPVS